MNKLSLNSVDQSCFRVCQHLLETGTFKVCSGVAVIHVEFRPRKAVLGGVLFEDQLLRGDAVGFRVSAVIAGQAAVKGRDSGFRFRFSLQVKHLLHGQ